jgi:hypothetical protein
MLFNFMFSSQILPSRTTITSEPIMSMYESAAVSSIVGAAKSINLKVEVNFGRVSLEI